MGCKASVEDIDYNGKRRQWYWNSASDTWGDDAKVEWEAYGDLQNEVIENAYSKKRPEADIGHYKVDFKLMVQVSKDNG